MSLASLNRPNSMSLESLESAPEQLLTLKITLLLALTSLKRVRDLQTLSVSEMCMDFAPGLVKVTHSLAMSPRFYPHRFALRWSRFTLFILLPHLQVWMKGFTCSVLSELWRYMWTAPNFGENLPSCWCALVLAVMNLPLRSTEFLTGWGILLHWLMRYVAFLHFLQRSGALY